MKHHMGASSAAPISNKHRYAQTLRRWLNLRNWRLIFQKVIDEELDIFQHVLESVLSIHETNLTHGNLKVIDIV